MKSITVSELDKMIKSNEDNIYILDIREDYEREIEKFTENHIPMGEIVNRYNELPRDKMVVIHCKSGKRSEAVINFLETEENFENLYSLEGGIEAWFKFKNS